MANETFAVFCGSAHMWINAKQGDLCQCGQMRWNPEASPCASEPQPNLSAVVETLEKALYEQYVFGVKRRVREALQQLQGVPAERKRT